MKIERMWTCKNCPGHMEIFHGEGGKNIPTCPKCGKKLRCKRPIQSPKKYIQI